MVLSVGYPVLGLLALGITFGLVPMSWNPFWFLGFVPLTLIPFVPEFFGPKSIGPRAHERPSS